ncbi:hypothetical protein, partial [Salmonella enterica]|uniref:hypothetical protein n=1 Tax=Salmonella enterica TaxID=28901 RepID=UPI0020C4B78C
PKYFLVFPSTETTSQHSTPSCGTSRDSSKLSPNSATLEVWMALLLCAAKHRAKPCGWAADRMSPHPATFPRRQME